VLVLHNQWLVCKQRFLNEQAKIRGSEEKSGFKKTCTALHKDGSARRCINEAWGKAQTLQRRVSSTEGVREALGMDRAWTWTWSKNETIYAVACTNIAAAKEECVELTSCE